MRRPEGPRTQLLDERARRQAAQREAAALRKTLADLLAWVDNRIESERRGFDDWTWDGRPDPAPIRARIDALSSVRDEVVRAVQRTAKRREP